MLTWPALASLVLLAAPPTGDPWVDVLRDHQATNHAALRQGRAHVFLTYRVANRTPVEVEAELAWIGNEYIQRYRYLDPDKVVFLRPTKRGQTLEQEPWNHRLKARDDYIVTNIAAGVAHVYSGKQNRDAIDSVARLTTFYPDAAWFGCCPPDGSASTPWPKWIGPYPPEDGLASGVEFHRVGEDLVQQIRRYDNGGEVAITFSLAHSGNVVKVQILNLDPNSSYTLKSGTYAWRKQGETSVLESMVFTTSPPGKRDAIQEEYRLKVEKVDLSPVPRRELTRAALMAELPQSIVIEDHITNRTIRPTVKIDGAALRGLSERLKGRGFAKP